MNLTKIAMDALNDYAKDQAEVNQDDGSVLRQNNGDGTVNLSFAFTLDPKVVAQKAKAMSKGVKRDDLTDDLAEGDNEVVFSDDIKDDFTEDEGEGKDDDHEGDEDPYNGVNTEDSAVAASADTIFMDALDSLDGVDVEDARQNSRHSQTPLEHCRAKDPRFCPYHGIVAWKSQIEDDIKKGGFSGSVEVTNDNGKFNINISSVSAKDEQAVMDLVKGYLGTNGVENAQESRKPSAGAANAGSVDVGGSFTKSRDMFDPIGRINEWVDDFMVDYAADPNADIDTDDFSKLLEAQEALETFEQGMNKQDPNDVQKFNDLVKSAEDQYHSLIAQQYYSHVADDNDASAEAVKIQDEYDTANDSFQDEIQSVRDIKTAIFGGKGEFPRANKKKGVQAFQDTHPWAKAYNKAASGVGRAGSDYANAWNSYTSANPADIKTLRTSLAAMDYLKDNFVQRAQAYPAAKQQFVKEFYDWATNEAADPNNQYGIDQAKIDQAWPNGRPQ